jgi:hypothetical protein
MLERNANDGQSVAGILSRAPVTRTLRSGGRCVTATLKAKDGDHTQFWYVVAFSETAQTELLHLSDGDAIAVQGSLKAELFGTGEQKKLSLGVIAEDVLPLRQPGKTRNECQAFRSPASSSGKPAIH